MTMAWSFCQQYAKHIISTFLTCTMHACHSRILGFLLLLVSYIGLKKNLSTVGYEMTTRFSYIVCVIFFFSGLIMVQNQTYTECQKL